MIILNDKGEKIGRALRWRSVDTDFPKEKFRSLILDRIVFFSPVDINEIGKISLSLNGEIVFEECYILAFSSEEDCDDDEHIFRNLFRLWINVFDELSRLN